MTDMRLRDQGAFASEYQHGMTYRQWLAGHILATLAGNDAYDVNLIAARAVSLADRLIHELARRPGVIEKSEG